MVEKIHDLAKNELNKRYGISKQPGKSLNVTTNDTLFTLFRKTADFIYRHGEWTKKDELTKEYYKNLLDNKKKLLQSLPKSFRKKIRLTKKEIKYLEDIINT